MIVPKDIYNFELFRWVQWLPTTTEEDAAIKRVLDRLCTRWLNFETKSFTDEEKQIIQEQGWAESGNIEIAARAQDVLRRDERDKRAMTRSASDLYMQVYDKTKESSYLIRSIQVRNIKVVCDEAYFEEVSTRLSQLEMSSLHMCIIALKQSYNEKLSSLQQIVANQYEALYAKQDYYALQDAIESLLLVGAITKEEADYRRALAYEAHADAEKAREDEHTFMMQVPSLYKSAYQLIYRVKEQHPDDEKRIKEKMIQANLNFTEKLSRYGEKIEYKVDENKKKVIDTICKETKITTLYEAVGLLRSLPFITEKSVTYYMEQSRKSFVSSMLSLSANDSQGNTVGNGSAEEALREEAHKHHRVNIYYAIAQYLRTIIAQHVNCSFDKWVEYMSVWRPKYIDENTAMLFAYGFTYAMEGDMVAASHILTPALEAFLRQWAESKHGSLRHYEKEREDERALDAILKVLEKDFDNYEEWFEYKAFLTMGIDENFRNELAHGMMSYAKMHNDGIYLFWLCFKMYFRDLNVEESV